MSGSDSFTLCRNIDRLIAELLDDAPPADWHDADAIAARARHLETAAALAGLTILEALVVETSRQDRQLGAGDEAPEAAGDALLALHKGLVAYQRSTLRRDGLEIAWSALEYAAGAGIAALTMGALDRLRAGLVDVAKDGWRAP